MQGQPPESPPLSNQPNFTCPLPPVACPSSLEQGASVQLEEGGSKMEDNVHLHNQASVSTEQEQEKERPIGEEPATTEITPPVGKSVETEERDSSDRKEEEEEEREEGESTVTTPTPLSPLLPPVPYPSIQAEREREQGIRCDSPKEEEITEDAKVNTMTLIIQHDCNCCYWF